LEKPVKGDVVVLPFPFSDLSFSKRRPALVLASLEGDDLILCQITSRDTQDRHSVSLLDSDFASGSLKQPSNVRPNKVFTADKSIVLYKAGSIQQSKLGEVIGKIVSVLQGRD
jgi:mRNA interferase MazF